MELLEGRCPKCGTNFKGWVIESYGGHVCLHCGAPLVNEYLSERFFNDVKRKGIYSNDNAFNGYIPTSAK